MSYNAWLYVYGRPTVLVDPSGLYRWRGVGEPHNLIEAYLETTHGGPGGWRIHREYQIPGAGGGRPDIIFIPYASTEHSSFHPSPLYVGGGFETPSGLTGYIYEIKPFDGPDSIARAQAQVSRYELELAATSPRLWDSLRPTGVGYDWRNLVWMPGYVPLPTGVAVLPFRDRSLAVWFAGSGAIMYADSDWTREYPDRIRRLPPYVFHAWREESEEVDQFQEAARAAPRGIPVRLPRPQDQEVLRVLLPIIPVVVWIAMGCPPFPVFAFPGR